jgi:hypothetical protein
MDGLVAFGLGQLGEPERICKAAFKSPIAVDRAVEPGALAQNLLRRGGVGPKIGVFGAGVQLLEALDRRIEVKDASSAGSATARSLWPGWQLRRA